MDFDRRQIVACPACSKELPLSEINRHLDNQCSERQHASETEHNSKLNPLSNKAKSISSPEATDVKLPMNPIFDPQYRKLQQLKRKKSQVETDLKSQPLAARLRPQTLQDFVGQSDLLSSDAVLKHLIENDKCPSCIFWGPSGTGKTTLAKIIAASTHHAFKELSATQHGIHDCRKVFEEAESLERSTGQKTLLFIDEIHRFSASQQDILLPAVEKGTVTLIGATTENPSFKINSALLSRCQVFVLKKLTDAEVLKILNRALKLLQKSIEPSILEFLAAASEGDARVALNRLETILNWDQNDVSLNSCKEMFKNATMLYDRSGDNHYDTISAFHKSIRGSDADATLFYLGRMLLAGEDPLYIARRMIRIASEDVGLADPLALSMAVATYQSVQQVGMPEADCCLAECAIYLAEARKSVRVYKAYNKVKQLLRESPEASKASIPLHLRNAPTRLMKELGYGADYKYNPDFADGIVVQDYMPEELADIKFLQPDI